MYLLPIWYCITLVILSKKRLASGLELSRVSVSVSSRRNFPMSWSRLGLGHEGLVSIPDISRRKSHARAVNLGVIACMVRYQHGAVVVGGALLFALRSSKTSPSFKASHLRVTPSSDHNAKRSLIQSPDGRRNRLGLRQPIIRPTRRISQTVREFLDLFWISRAGQYSSCAPTTFLAICQSHFCNESNSSDRD